MKINVKGIKMYLYVGGASPGQVVPTGYTAGNPTVIDVVDTTGMVTGQPVVMAGTDLEELDGNTFVVGAVTGTSFS